MPNLTKYLLCLLLFPCLLVAACSKGDQARIPVQVWNGIKVKIETHPYPVRAGYNEIWLMARRVEGGPAHNIIVSLRANESKEWVQSVQDGHIGVFRRAVEVERGDRHLYVQLRDGGQSTELKFELPWPQ